MFRVSKAEERSRTVITIDGQLSADSVEVIGACCDQAQSAGKPVHLFLRDVSSIDRAGRALLRRLAAKGIHLIASGVYTSYLIRRLDSTGTEPANSADAGEPPTRIP